MGEIVKSIEFEKRSTNFKTAGLTRQVEEYNAKLSNLKKEANRRKRRLNIIRKEFCFDTYSATYQQRLFHQRQLEIVEGEQMNLTHMAESLSARLRVVVNECQSLNSTLDPVAQINSNKSFPDGAMAISNNAHFKQL